MDEDQGNQKQSRSEDSRTRSEDSRIDIDQIKAFPTRAKTASSNDSAATESVYYGNSNKVIQEDAIREKESLYDSKTRMEAAKAAEAETYVKILEQDMDERLKYARRLFSLICLWLSGIYIAIILSAVNPAVFWFDTNGDGQEDIEIIRRLELSDTGD